MEYLKNKNSDMPGKQLLLKGHDDEKQILTSFNSS
jgi:hypothetical protein